MASNYTVVAAEKLRDKPDKGYGPMQDIGLTLRNDAGKELAGITWYTKQGTEPPASGTTLFGDVTSGQFGYQFKRAKSFPTGSYGGGQRDFKADPVKQAAIAAEAAQKVAVDTIRLAIEHKQNPAELARQIVEVSRVLLDQIHAEMKAAE